MSHATVLVALSPQDLNQAKNDLESAVHWQMQPFDEGDEWFQDGSRWDWYQIGGRYEGRLLGRDYCRRSDLSEPDLENFQLKRANELWDAFESEKSKDDFIRSFIYGFSKDETRESLRERMKSNLLSAYAFLRDRRWHEGERMGWFGAPARTECEVAAEEIGKEHEGVCTVEDPQTGARIITFAEESDRWSANFYRRFVKNLAPETTLVMVDYHV